MSTVETITSFDKRAEATNRSLAPRIALAAATVGAGLSAGLFYAFQVSVILALAEVDDVTYVKTFQAINDKIQNPWFLTVFLGTPPLIAAALVLNRRSVRRMTALIGAGLILNIALIAITAAGNIPLNDDLARYDTVTPDAAATARSDFEQPWNRLNFARTVVAVASFVSLAVATILKPAAHPLPGSANRRPAGGGG